MKPEAQRMMAELLGRQLGMDAGQLATAMEGDPLTAILTLSMMSQSNAQASSRAPEADAAERLARIAAMVGACSLCLGEDALCTRCRGAGKPGRRPPDIEALLEWIELPLRRAGLCVTERRPARTQPNGEGEPQ